MVVNLLDLSECQDWTPWRNALGVASKAGGYVVEYIFFVLYSVGSPSSLDFAPADVNKKVLFATCASILVRTYAAYAKHSGIPEIKTVLGGFVIRKFMGPWTLVIKSLGLVRAVPLQKSSCCSY